MSYYRFTQTGTELQSIFDNVQDIQKDTNHTWSYQSGSLGYWIKNYFLSVKGGTLEADLKFANRYGVYFYNGSTTPLTNLIGWINVNSNNDLLIQTNQRNINLLDSHNTGIVKYKDVEIANQTWVNNRGFATEDWVSGLVSVFLSKDSTASCLYGTDSSGNQVMMPYNSGSTTAAMKSTIAQRLSSGALNVGTPTANAHATTKKYVDDLLLGKLSTGGGTITGNLQVDNELIVDGDVYLNSNVDVASLNINNKIAATQEWVNNQGYLTAYQSLKTFNGSSTLIGTGNAFYAPTTSGTSGYYLKSNGLNAAPTWASTANFATKTVDNNFSTTQTINGDLYVKNSSTSGRVFLGAGDGNIYFGNSTDYTSIAGDDVDVNVTCPGTFSWNNKKIITEDNFVLEGTTLKINI